MALSIAADVLSSECQKYHHRRDYVNCKRLLLLVLTICNCNCLCRFGFYSSFMSKSKCLLFTFHYSVFALASRLNRLEAEHKRPVLLILRSFVKLTNGYKWAGSLAGAGDQ